MSNNNLRLQVILNAVDKITRPFRSAQASSKGLAAAIQASKARLKELDAQASRIEGFRKIKTQLGATSDSLKAAREEAAKLATEFANTSRPTARQTRQLEQAKNRVNDLKEKYNGLRLSVQRQREALRGAGIDTKQLGSAQRGLRADAESVTASLARQQQELKRLGERQSRVNAARAQYSRSLEIRDRIAGGGATTAATGIAMGAPVVAAIKSYSTMEDAMKGVAKQVNGLRDDNGNRTSRFYEMQDAIKTASESVLPMQNGAVDYAALIEGGARMNVANPNDSWEDQKRDLLAFASTAAKASTAFELPADELAEGLGKIAQLYKIPTRNIEQLGDALNYLDDNAMSKGSDIIDVLQRMGGVADRLDYRKAAALGSTFLSLGAAPEIAASASNAMVRELSIASMQGKNFMAGMELLKLNPEALEKSMTKDAMSTIQHVLARVNSLPADKRLGAMTMVFGKEFGDDAAKLANNLPELQRQLKLTGGSAAYGSMQKESDINSDSLSAQAMLVKAGLVNTFSSLGETLRQPLMDIMGVIKRVTGATRRWIEANPELVGGIMKVAAVVAAIVVSLGTLAIGVAAVIGPLAIMRLGFKYFTGGILSQLVPKFGGLGGALAKIIPKLTEGGGGIKSLFSLFTSNEASESLSFLDKIKSALGGMNDAEGDDDEGGLFGAFKDGALNSLKEQAEEAGAALMSAFRNPGAAITALRGKIAALVAPGLAALSSAIRKAGAAALWLVTSPLAILRSGLMFIGSAIGVLLSPVGLLIAALTGVALVIWKHWKPIKAFLGGVVEGFKAAAAPISAAFEPLQPVFTWIGDKVQALFGWFKDLLAPVKSTKEELESAAAMGKQFGQFLADGINFALHPLDSLKSGVSWLLDKMGIIQKESAKLPSGDSIKQSKPATVTSGRVNLPPGGFPGFAGMYDSGGNIPSGQFGIVGENGPEIVGGPLNVTSRRRTAQLAASAALAMGVAATPAGAMPLHPMSLPARAYQQDAPRAPAGGQLLSPVTIHAPISIMAQPGQSAQDIAKEVARQLDERERQARARGRSSFSDQGEFE